MRKAAIALLVIAAASWYGGAQILKPPLERFEYMTLDVVHRGHFNISDCMREFMNCWELVKPDSICKYYYTYESICGTMLFHCSEEKGARYSKPSFPISPTACYE